MLDKKAVWEEITTSIDGAVSRGVYFMLLEDCHLDKIEGHVATILATSEIIKTIILRKAMLPLRYAFSEKMGKPMQVRVLEKAVRIYEDPVTLPTPDTEEAILLERYGDIIGIVQSHPVFDRACRKTEKGGWNIFPQLLTIYCKAFGITAVLKGLRRANETDIKNPRGFFFQSINQGQYGPILPGGRELLDELSKEYRKEEKSA